MLAFYSLNSAGQEIVTGDSTVVDEIKRRTSEIYENRDRTDFFLTKKPLRQMKIYGTEIIVHSNKGAVNRIIAKSTTKRGQLSTEWYFTNDELIYAYESFEYFNEYKGTKGWKNFKGLQAWEGRYYFVDQSIKYQKHKGRKPNQKGHEVIAIQKDGKAILEYIVQHPTEEKIYPKPR